MVGGDLLLLAADYGASELCFFENAINLNKSFEGMRRIATRVQCFFVDACRQVPVAGLNIQDAGAKSLITALEKIEPRRRDAPLLHASSYDEQAYGGPGSTSRFTKALLRAFRGAGGKESEGRWMFTSSSLGDAVNKIVARLNRLEGGPEQHSKMGGEVGGTIPIHVLTEPPAVPVTLRFDPPQAVADADLAIKSYEDPRRVYQRPPQPGDWELAEVVADAYNLKAEFHSRRYRNLSKSLIVKPPLVQQLYRLEVNP